MEHKNGTEKIKGHKKLWTFTPFTGSLAIDRTYNLVYGSVNDFTFAV